MDAKRISTSIYIFFFLFSSHFLFGQKADLLKRRVNLEYEDAPLERVLIALSNEADFNFSYNAGIIRLDTTVTVHVENSSVKDVLDVILMQDISYQASGNHLILLKERPKETLSDKNVKYEIKGYVYDAETGEILPNVSVFDASKLISTLSDSSGYYQISLSSKYEQLNLFYSKRNFSDTLIIVQPADQNLDVSLTRVEEDMVVNKIESKSVSDYARVENIGIVQQFVSRDQMIQAQNIDIEETRLAQISILPKIGTNMQMSGLVKNRFSLNILAGYSLGLKNGIEVGGLLNVDRKDVSGLQIGGLGNVVGGTTSGVQIGGLFNNNGKNMVGVQMAGFSNVIMDTIQGVQISGFSNILRGSMYGWQVAGFNNFTTESVDGVQLAGFTNIAMKDVDLLQLSGAVNLGDNVNGFQVTGMLNVARHNVGGAQIAGMANYGQTVNMSQIAGLGNIASKTVNGVQIAALFNYANYVKGGQVSLLNIADSVGGVPVGLISFVRKGYHKVELSAEEILYANITYKMGVRRFYNIFTAGIQPGMEEPVWGFGYGFGTQIGKRRVTVNLDWKGTQIMEPVDEQAFNVSFRFTPQLAVRIAKGFTFFTGPSINLHVSDLRDPETGEFITSIAPEQYLLWEDVPGDLTLFQLWAGGTAGFRFF